MGCGRGVRGPGRRWTNPFLAGPPLVSKGVTGGRGFTHFRALLSTPSSTLFCIYTRSDFLLAVLTATYFASFLSASNNTHTHTHMSTFTRVYNHHYIYLDYFSSHLQLRRWIGSGTGTHGGGYFLLIDLSRGNLERGEGEARLCLVAWLRISLFFSTFGQMEMAIT